jgi:hypothetical protein
VIILRHLICLPELLHAQHLLQPNIVRR